MYDYDFYKSTVIVFGNEHEGLTVEVQGHLDGKFLIPQFGMVQSLNISVACTARTYEALSRLTEADKYYPSEMSAGQESLP